MASWEEERNAERKSAKQTILDKCADWGKLGITQVECNYAGSGDEGFIEGFIITPETITQEAAGIGEYGNPVYDAFDRLTFAEVSETNEGGGGTITVNVNARKITRQEYYYGEPTRHDLKAKAV
jgi:hypothetical protein